MPHTPHHPFTGPMSSGANPTPRTTENQMRDVAELLDNNQRSLETNRKMANPMADEMRRFRGSDEKNPFEAMSERFDRAAQLLGLDTDLYAVMRVPSREIKVYIPVRMDTGHIQVFEGFRVQHNFARGPAKGGIRYAPDVSLDE